MKRLILFRHAKSSWDDETLTDHERPLAPRGKESVPKMGKFLKQEKLFPQLILCSTAKRAKETLSIFINEIKEKIPIRIEKSIYTDGLTGIIDLLQTLPASIDFVMMIGHNPDFEEAAGFFTQGYFPYKKFSTGSIALIEFNIKNWKEVDEGKGSLVLYKSPKML